MKTASDVKDTVMDLSRTYFGEPDRAEGFMGHTWPASTDSRRGDKPRRERILPDSNFQLATWGGWSGQGIPELASPLAD